MKFDPATYRLTEKGRFDIFAGVGGALFLIISLWGLMNNQAQFYHSLLVSFAFWTSVGLGGLFFVMLHHLTGARWSAPVRRLAENFAATLPYLAIIFLAIYLGRHELYHWTHAEAVAEDHLLQWKLPYLNDWFFLVRGIGYFAVWYFLTRLLTKYSRQQDSASPVELIARMRKTSAPGMIVFALTSTFAAFDWLMSLDPHWYSTIFGVYFFAGCAVAIMCALTLTAIFLRKNKVLTDCIGVEHYHDLGRLTFAFTIFWAYMAFSQYFLIWYANIPEETIWFLHRWEGSWKTISLLLVFGHFIVPFFIMITRGAKRNYSMLMIMSVWLLIIHYVDIFWIVMPGLHKEGFSYSWLDFTTLAGVGGIFLAVFWRRLSRSPLVPLHDPKFQESKELTKV